MKYNLIWLFFSFLAAVQRERALKASRVYKIDRSSS